MSQSDHSEFRLASQGSKLALQEEVTLEAGDAQSNKGLLVGWCSYLTWASVFTGLFLVQLDMTVVTTALVAIGDDLQDLRRSIWIIDAYFLAWTGFVILWAQFSHVLGRKPSFILALGLFVIFSAACAAAQTSVELYLFRGLQGLSGAGVYGLSTVIMSDGIPASSMPKYTSIVAVISVVSFAVGPLIGGSIAARTTWRWIFILNVPTGCVALLMFSFALPTGFPHHRKPKSERLQFRLSSVKRLDLLGGILFLSATLLIVSAFQEASVSYPWRSSVIICLLVFSALSAVGFTMWERLITSWKPNVTPILTYQFVQRRMIAMLASSALIGIPFIFTLVQIPQSLQLIDRLSPLRAGINLLPFSTLVSVGAILASVFGRKYQFTPIYGQLVGALLQLIAVICFAVEPLKYSPHHNIPPKLYGFQVLMGLGSGIAYNVNFNGIYHAVGNRKELIASSFGANVQFRFSGAALGLAAVTAAFNTYTRMHLSEFLSPDQIAAVLQSQSLVATLNPEDQIRVLHTFAMGFTLQWRIMCGFVGLQIIAILLTY